MASNGSVQLNLDDITQYFYILGHIPRNIKIMPIGRIHNCHAFLGMQLEVRLTAPAAYPGYSNALELVTI
jgi:hypothetical protein